MSNIGWADAIKAKREQSIVLKIYRNDACFCRSGKKYKNCCHKKHGKNPRVKYTLKQ